jgi:hypothetical protein
MLGFPKCNCFSKKAWITAYSVDMITEPHAVVTVFLHRYSWYYTLAHARHLIFIKDNATTTDWNLHFHCNCLSVNDMNAWPLTPANIALVIWFCRQLSATEIGQSLNLWCHSNTSASDSLITTHNWSICSISTSDFPNHWQNVMSPHFSR